jgi:two-component system phosphate regulon sensor histidine kinase PhoR
LKLRRNLYVIVAGIAAGSLLLGGLAECMDFGIGAGSHSAGYAQNGSPVVLVCLLIGAVGVIWLGWYLVKLAGGIASIARLLRQDEPARIKPGSNAKINHLITAINDFLGTYTARNLALEEQVKDLEIQIQLSQRQKRNTEAIIYSIRDAVIVVDEFDKLLMANEAAARLFNFDFGDSQRKPIDELIESGKSEFVDFLRQSRRGKVRHTRRELDFSGEGEGRTFDCNVSCVRDEKNEVCGVAAVLHDITREKEISQMKNDFVSHVSHELKTPLASITAYSEMLSDGEAEDEETRKEFYSVIQSQAERLNRLIEDILNTSRIESGLIKVDKKPLSLTILIEEQLPMIKSCAEEKDIEIVSQKPIVFDQVYADKDMLSQVIVNLLSNAVKYTPAGGTVRIETGVDETADMARVSVTDTGVGIPEDEVEHVFDRFYRVGANKSCAKGTGLGLNLVKQIVEKVHNGQVFVMSKPGVGSTFGFELPLAKAETVEAV